MYLFTAQWSDFNTDNGVVMAVRTSAVQAGLTASYHSAPLAIISVSSEPPAEAFTAHTLCCAGEPTQRSYVTETRDCGANVF